MIREDKIKEWVDKYLAHIHKITVDVHAQKEEGYKFKAVDNFQKNFNIDAKNLPAMLETSIANNNLVIGSYYFPRNMLVIFAKEYEDQTRTALRDLFDESKPVKSRIDKATEFFDNLIRERNKITKKNDHSFIGIRFLSLLLGYKYPNKYNALKPREWKNYCKFIDNEFSIPNKTSHGAQYEMFQPYIESLRGYIRTLPEINSIRLELTKRLEFQDEEFRWMSQDVIYVTSKVMDDIYAGTDANENNIDQANTDALDEEGKTVTINDRFAYEQYLQTFCQENFEKINFLSNLSIYTDDTGKQGFYYGTKYGEIDILATDANGNFVVIELKRERAADKAVNQLGRYMQWVDENLAAKNNKKVRGILISHACNNSLLGSVKALRFPVAVLLYKLKIDLVEFGEV